MSKEPVYDFHEKAAEATVSKLQAEAAAQHSANRIADAKAFVIRAVGFGAALGLFAILLSFAFHIYGKKPIVVTEYVKQKEVVTTTVEVPVNRIQRIDNDVVVTKIERVDNDVVVTRVEKVDNDVIISRPNNTNTGTGSKTVVAEEIIKDGNPTGYYAAGTLQTKGPMYTKYNPETNIWSIEGWIETSVPLSPVPTTITYDNGKMYTHMDKLDNPQLLTYTYITPPKSERDTETQSNKPVSVTYHIDDKNYVFPVVVTKTLKGPMHTDATPYAPRSNQ